MQEALASWGFLDGLPRSSSRSWGRGLPWRKLSCSRCAPFRRGSDTASQTSAIPCELRRLQVGVTELKRTLEPSDLGSGLEPASKVVQSPGTDALDLRKQHPNRLTNGGKCPSPCHYTPPTFSYFFRAPFLRLQAQNWGALWLWEIDPYNLARLEWV